MSAPAVTVYTKASGCKQCEATTRRLEQRGIDFEEIVVDPDDETDLNAAALKFLGFTGVPVVYVDGLEPWVGYRPDSIDALVGVS